jgi:hypothetical protein
MSDVNYSERLAVGLKGLMTGEEIWFDILGYENYYQCSNFGRVKSLPRVVPHKRWKTYTVRG